MRPKDLKSKSELARRLGMTISHLSNCLAGRRNASPKAAKEWGRETESDPFAWMEGGSPSDRREAVENWAARQG